MTETKKPNAYLLLMVIAVCSLVSFMNGMYVGLYVPLDSIQDTLLNLDKNIIQLLGIK